MDVIKWVSQLPLKFVIIIFCSMIMFWFAMYMLKR